MIRKSNQLKDKYLREIGEAVYLYQETTDLFDDVAATLLGLNRTDLKCLGVIFQKGEVSASDIATATFLTRGATTTALDRVEKAGFAERIRDNEDRRSVQMRMTGFGKEKVLQVWGPLVKRGNEILATYELKELEVILRFLVESRSSQMKQIEKMRSLKGAQSSKKRKSE